jgi:hypothetical protein
MRLFVPLVLAFILVFGLTVVVLPSFVSASLYYPESSNSTTGLVYSAVALVIVFGPALMLNFLFPRVGFVAGIIVMSVALFLSGVLEFWLTAVIFIGVVVLIFRGGE